MATCETEVIGEKIIGDQLCTYTLSLHHLQEDESLLLAGHMRDAFEHAGWLNVKIKMKTEVVF